MRMPRSRPGVAASLGLCVNASPSPGSASPSIPPGIEPASSESPASASSTRPRVSGPTSKLTRSRALFAERALPARASTLQTYTASPSPTLAHRAPRESNATARTAPQCAPYACDGTFERHSAGANGSRNPARGAATSDLSRPPRTASVPVASTATASTPAQRFRPTACGAPSPCSSAQLCLDTASSSFATTQRRTVGGKRKGEDFGPAARPYEPRGHERGRSQLQRLDVERQDGLAVGADRREEFTVGRNRRADPVGGQRGGQVLDRQVPVLGVVHAQVPLGARGDHARAVGRELNGDDVALVLPVLRERRGGLDVEHPADAAAEANRERPPRRLGSVLAVHADAVPTRAVRDGAGALSGVAGELVQLFARGAIPHSRSVPSSEHVAISSRPGSGSKATPVTAPACERSSVRYACEGMSMTPRLPVLVAAATCRPSAETEHEVTADSCSASRKKSEKSVGHTRRNPSSDAVTAKPSETRRSLMRSSCS